MIPRMIRPPDITNLVYHSHMISYIMAPAARRDGAGWGRQTPVLGAGVQLNGDCLDPARGLVAVDAVRVVSRCRLVVIEKSRLAAAGCAAHAGKAPMQRGLGSTVQAPDSDDIWASSMDSEFKMDSCWKLKLAE